MSTTVELDTARIYTTIAIISKQVDEGVQALMSNSKNHKRLIGLDTISLTRQAREGIKTTIFALELCDESQCLIVRLPKFKDCYNGLPRSLYNFLSLPSFTFVGFGIKDALASLRQGYGFVCKNALEAGPSGSPKLIHSVNNVLRTMHIPPMHCISGSTWCLHGNLTEEFIKFAVSNAHAAFRIGDIIHS